MTPGLPAEQHGLGPREPCGWAAADPPAGVETPGHHQPQTDPRLAPRAQRGPRGLGEGGQPARPAAQLSVPGQSPCVRVDTGAKCHCTWCTRWQQRPGRAALSSRGAGRAPALPGPHRDPTRPPAALAALGAVPAATCGLSLTHRSALRSAPPVLWDLPVPWSCQSRSAMVRPHSPAVGCLCSRDIKDFLKP